jgi:Tannase and feruloyl esterase
VKSGASPSRQNLVQTKKDKSGEAVTTRPMCKYPAWPRCKGTGDVNAASSFECLME